MSCVGGRTLVVWYVTAVGKLWSGIHEQSADYSEIFISSQQIIVTFSEQSANCRHIYMSSRQNIVRYLSAVGKLSSYVHEQSANYRDINIYIYIWVVVKLSSYIYVYLYTCSRQIPYIYICLFTHLFIYEQSAGVFPLHVNISTCSVQQSTNLNYFVKLQNFFSCWSLESCSGEAPNCNRRQTSPPPLSAHPTSY